MGRAKEEWMASNERGYDMLYDSVVCEECIQDSCLRQLHAENSSRGDCCFCDKTDVFVADAELIQEQIMKSLLSDYEDIQDSGAPYETREGGWQIRHELAKEIVDDELAGVVSDAFREAIVDAVHLDASWCERDWTILSPIARMRHGWNQFCLIVRTRLRFSFSLFESDEDPNHPDYTHPNWTLLEIGQLVDSLQLVATLPVKSRIYRVRVDADKFYEELPDLGSPPPFKAAANRMSPAGIPMFYAADDVDTAIAETWDGVRSAVASIAIFDTIKPIRVIDFTNIPECPSYWSNPGREILAEYSFLQELAYDLSKPVTRGGKVDIDYAPTQIVSEYLTKAKYGLPRSWNPPSGLVHGLAFHSSRTSGKNYGFNFLHESDPLYGLNQSDYLKLVAVERRELSPPTGI